MTLTRPALRIGHAERNAAIAALDEHLKAGRLDYEEYGERMARASLALTVDELAALFVDLPQPNPFPPLWQPAPVPPAPAAWHAPAPTADAWYDPRTMLWLPRGTELAGVGRRIGAFVLSGVLFVLTLGIGYLIWALLAWTRGQTPAFQVLGLRAYRPSTGRMAGFWWMALREVIGRWVELIGWLLPLSFVLFVATRRHRCLADYVGGTVVLQRRRA